MELVEIYTDGSSSLKMREGGIGAVIIIDNKVVFEINKGIKNLKTGQAELLAIYYTLKFCEHKEIKTVLYSDSQYAIKSFTEWWKTWEKNDFIGIKNLKLLKATKIEIDKFSDLSFVHIKGHTGNFYNEMADKLATKARKYHQTGETYQDILNTL